MYPKTLVKIHEGKCKHSDLNNARILKCYIKSYIVKKAFRIIRKCHGYSK